MNGRVTKGRVLGGGYSPRDAALLSDAAAKCLAWWKAQTGSGITLTKSDARFLLDARTVTGACADAEYTFFKAYHIDPLIYNHFSLGQFAADTYTAHYFGGSFKFLSDAFGGPSNGWATAIGANGIAYNGGNAYKTIQAFLTENQALTVSQAATLPLVTNPPVIGTVSHGGGHIYAHFEDPNLADNKWMSANLALNGFIPNPIYGISHPSFDETKYWLADTPFHDMSGYLGADHPDFRGKQHVSIVPWKYAGSDGCWYKTTFQLSIYAPCRQFAPYGGGFNQAFQDFLYFADIGGDESDPDGTVWPRHNGVGFEMVLDQKTYSFVWMGLGLDNPYYDFVDYWYIPSHPHVGGWASIKLVSTQILGKNYNGPSPDITLVSKP